MTKFVDALALARTLEGDARYSRLASAIRSASLVQSCISDLTRSAECCLALEGILISPRKKGSAERSATENALLTTAVLYYARATVTSGQKGERGSSSISDKLDADQIIDHEALTLVRNRAIAHVYADEVLEDEAWHSSKLLFISEGTGWRPASVSRGITFHKGTLGRLQRLLPVANAILTERFEKYTARIVELLNTHPVSRAVYEQHVIDAIEYFGSQRTVDAVLSAQAPGHGTARDSR